MPRKRKTKADVLRAIGRGTAGVTRGAGDLAERHKKVLSASGEAVVKGAGLVTRTAGGAIEGLGEVTDRWSGDQAAKATTVKGKVLGRTLQGTAKSVRLVGWMVGKIGGMVSRSSKTAGDMATGATIGALRTGADAIDSVSISAEELEAMQEALRDWGANAQAEGVLFRQRIDGAVAQRRRENLLELMTVGGVSLAEAVRAPSTVPAEVLEAYVLAYPNLARQFSFQEVVERLHDDQIVGFAAGVKGKLFEIEFVDHLNESVLEEGYTASLAESATQQGWDIKVTGPDGATVEWIQAKATDSASYVLAAMQRHPEIDITTTSEVYAELVARGMAEGVRNSGIAEAALDSAIQKGVDAATGQISGLDILPGGIGLAAIGMSVFFDRTVPDAIKAMKAGKQMGQAFVPMLLGKIALVSSQAWWVGLIAGAGSSWLAGRGRVKRARFESLRSVMSSLEL